MCVLLIYTISISILYVHGKDFRLAESHQEIMTSTSEKQQKPCHWWQTFRTHSCLPLQEVTAGNKVSKLDKFRFMISLSKITLEI